MLIAVMSYNRGNYLKKCVEALELHLPSSEIKVYDDGSTCKLTQKVLEEIKIKHQVYIAGSDSKIGKHRGLYNNMNIALKEAIERRFNYIFYIQDDIQLVRRADGEFLNECKEIFKSDSRIVQIQPVFFKGETLKEEYNKFTTINREVGYYEGNILGISGIADVGITRIAPLSEQNWMFSDSESNNMSLGSKLGWKYVKPKNPIMMYTPWPETFRNKKGMKRYLMKLADRKYNAAFYSYIDMTDSNIHSLNNRSIEEYPYAEDYLKLNTSVNLVKPWHYSSSYEYVMSQIVKLLKQVYLYKIVKTVFGLFKK